MRRITGLVMLLVILASCSGSNDNALSPAKVIEGFYQACKAKNYDAAKAFLTPASIAFFNTQEQADAGRGFNAFVDFLATNLNAPEFDNVKSQNERIEDNTATVDTAFVYRDNEPDYIPHRLVREKTWNIDMVSTLEQVSDLPQEGYRADLAKNGRWLKHPKYGDVWRPNNVAYNWQPYGQDGRFVRTDEGWDWQSEQPWGDRVFHYGRWAQSGPWGWVWVPDEEYAPSKVAWRANDDYIGWAPLAPRVPVNDNSFRPPSPAWTFVPTRQFVDIINRPEPVPTGFRNVRVADNQYPELLRSSQPFINDELSTVLIQKSTGIPVRTIARRRDRDRSYYINDKDYWKEEKRRRKAEEKYYKELEKADKKRRKELEKEFKRANKHRRDFDDDDDDDDRHGRGHGRGRGKGHHKGRGRGHDRD